MRVPLIGLDFIEAVLLGKGPTSHIATKGLRRYLAPDHP